MKRSGGAENHSDDRLRAVKGLDLRLSIDAEHQRLLRRVQVQAADVADLLHELRVGGQLEGLLSVRFEAERPPDPRDRDWLIWSPSPSTGSTNGPRRPDWISAEANLMLIGPPGTVKEPHPDRPGARRRRRPGQVPHRSTGRHRRPTAVPTGGGAHERHWLASASLWALDQVTNKLPAVAFGLVVKT